MSETVCAKCSERAEFGYKIKGDMQWFCAQHRLAKNYADARLPRPEQKTESKQVARPLQFHPLAEIFPLIEGQEFNELVADIRTHGIREPIWTYDGRIIDGRNRYRAASSAGIECPVRKYTGADPVSFVISLNLKTSPPERIATSDGGGQIGYAGAGRQSAFANWRNLPG